MCKANPALHPVHWATDLFRKCRWFDQYTSSLILVASNGRDLFSEDRKWFTETQMLGAGCLEWWGWIEFNHYGNCPIERGENLSNALECAVQNILLTLNHEGQVAALVFCSLGCTLHLFLSSQISLHWQKPIWIVAEKWKMFGKFIKISVNWNMLWIRSSSSATAFSFYAQTWTELELYNYLLLSATAFFLVFQIYHHPCLWCLTALCSTVDSLRMCFNVLCFA